MPNFVVERYRPSSHPDSLSAVADRLTAGARQVSPDGTSVRYLDTIFLPGDETCLHLFEADSEANVRAAARQAGVEVDRIVRAEQIERRQVGWRFDGPTKGERP
jgi:Protein of unknown function (DUF4242)